MSTGRLFHALTIRSEKEDFVVGRLFLKLFKTSNMNSVRDCQRVLNFELPSVTVASRAARCVSAFPVSCRNLLQCAQFDTVSLPLNWSFSFCLIFINCLFACLNVSTDEEEEAEEGKEGQ